MSRRVSSEPRRFGPRPGKPRLKAEKVSLYRKTKTRSGKQRSRSLKPEKIGYEPGRLSPKHEKLSLEPGRLSSDSSTDIEQGRLS
jgi:hypothetical protein